MEDKELFELCKSVYEKTGWKGQHFWYMPEMQTAPNGQPLITDHYIPVYQPSGSRIGFPLYTSDYILEKLPDAIKHPEHGYKWRLQLKKIGKWYVASYENELWVRVYMANEYRTDEKLYTWKEPYTADTPLKALLKLTLALHDAGERLLSKASMANKPIGRGRL